MAPPRFDAIDTLHRRHKDLYRALGGVGLFALGVLVGALFFRASLPDFASDLFANLLTGALLLGGIHMMISRREAQRLRHDLLRQTASTNNSLARDGAATLRDLGWLTGPEGLLQARDLKAADLSFAILREANLRGTDLKLALLYAADLYRAELQEADISECDCRLAYMERANLRHGDCWKTDFADADLQRAVLRDCKLEEAKFTDAFLGEANLIETNVWRADFRGAVLAGASLRGAEEISAAFFSPRTVLPDAVFVGEDDEGEPLYDTYWSPETDMTRYSDPDHPDFWEPEWSKPRTS